MYLVLILAQGCIIIKVSTKICIHAFIGDHGFASVCTLRYQMRMYTHCIEIWLCKKTHCRFLMHVRFLHRPRIDAHATYKQFRFHHGSLGGLFRSSRMHNILNNRSSKERVEARHIYIFICG